MGRLDIFGLKPSKSAFAKSVLLIFKQTGIEVASYDETAFCVNLGSGLIHFLDNHYREYCAAWPWARTTVSERYARSLLVHEANAPLIQWKREKTFASSFEMPVTFSPSAH